MLWDHKPVLSDGWSSGSYHPERDMEMRHTTVFTCELRGPARPPTARGTSTEILDHRAPRYMLLYNSHEQSHISTINPSETEAFCISLAMDRERGTALLHPKPGVCGCTSQPRGAEGVRKPVARTWRGFKGVWWSQSKKMAHAMVQ